MADKKIGITYIGPYYLNMPSLLEPSAPTLKNGEKGALTYNQECVFDLEDDEQKEAFKTLQDHCLKVVQAKFGKDASLKEVPGQFKFRSPWKLGDTKAEELKKKGKDGSTAEFYKGKVIVRVTTKYLPMLGVVENGVVREEVRASDLYSGCIGKSEVNVVVMEPINGDEDAKGFIKIYLNATIKIDDGARISGKDSSTTLASLAGVSVSKAVDDDEDEIEI